MAFLALLPLICYRNVIIERYLGVQSTPRAADTESRPILINQSTCTHRFYMNMNEVAAAATIARATTDFDFFY